MNRRGRVRKAARGFTVLELVLALVLSAIIAMSALSVFWMLTSSETRQQRRLDDQADFIIVQTAVRRAMASLLAAKPQEPTPATEAAAEAQGLDAQAADAPADADQDLKNLIASVTGDAALAEELTAGAGSDRPHFELYFQPAGAIDLPALEVKVMESPVPPPADSAYDPRALGVEQFLPVRGVFEVLELGDGLALQWRPIDPPGPATILIQHLAAIEWQALPHKQDWVDLYAAYLESEYPDGVRLLLWTNNGAHVDWFFDTAVTTPEGTR